MSKQRYLLIAFGLLLACVLQAQSEFTLKSDVALLKGTSSTGITGANRLYWNHSFSPRLEVNASSDLNAADMIVPPNTQKIWHNANAGIRYTTEALNLHGDYRNMLFGHSQLLGMYTAWKPSDSQKRLMQHQGTLSAEYNATYIKADAYAQAKYLRYTPYELDPNTFELVQKDDTGGTDIYYGLAVQSPAWAGISASLSAQNKDGLYAEQGQYQLSELTAGLNADYKILSQSTLTASFNWTNRNGDAIPDQKRNFLQTTVRYRQRFSDAIAAYLLYINNSCVNSSVNELYLLSNYLRGQLQYSFPTDPSGGSYLMLGGKYSPENKADAYFAEADYRVWNNLYTGAALNLQPDRQTTYTGKVSFYVTPVNELHLQYTHRKNTHLNFETDYLGLGSSIYW